MKLQDIETLIKDVPDFPKPGIVFKDITPLLAHPQGLRAVVRHMADAVAGQAIDGILAIESRGFIFGATLAAELEVPMHLVRKRGKLPREIVSVEYDLEYGSDHLEVHADAIEAGKRYLIVDDVVATGGTAAAVTELVAQQRAEIAACLFVIELAFLRGRDRLGSHVVSSLLVF